MGRDTVEKGPLASCPPLQHGHAELEHSPETTAGSSARKSLSLKLLEPPFSRPPLCRAVGAAVTGGER